MIKVTARDQGHYKGPSGAFVTYCNISCFFFFFYFAVDMCDQVQYVESGTLRFPDPYALSITHRNKNAKKKNVRCNNANYKMEM